jgi:hypothetical protein
VAKIVVCTHRHSFDSPALPRHNRQVILRRALSASVFLVLLATPCLNLCAGWNASAGMRMACCVGSDDHGAQAAADACCALGEHRQNAESAGRLLSAALPALDLTQATIESLAVPVLQGSRLEAGEHNYVPSTSDRHLLLSVFLI